MQLAIYFFFRTHASREALKEFNDCFGLVRHHFSRHSDQDLDGPDRVRIWNSFVEFDRCRSDEPTANDYCTLHPDYFFLLPHFLE